MDEKMIKTPRGLFYLADHEEAVELKTEGYGLHHEHGKYVIVSNGCGAMAVTKSDYNEIW